MNDNSRTARLIMIGPVGNWIYERLAKTDYDRQADAILRMKKEGMEHGQVKMSSKHRGKIFTSQGNAGYTEQHDGEYKW